MTGFSSPFRFFRATDALVIGFLLLLSLVAIAAGLSQWGTLLAINVGASVAIGLLAYGASVGRDAAVRFVHDWYPVPLVLFAFKEVYVVIQSLGLNDWDNLFIAFDRAIFGGIDPTVWLAKLTVPVVTEILQIAYASYYFIMLAVTIELYVRKEQQKFTYVVFTILYGFFLSYIGYLLFPAVGPRFTLHSFDTINTDLPGVWLTNSIRDLLNAGESIPKNAANAIAIAQRDAFPSGHTQMTLISIYFAHQYRLKSRYVVTVFGLLLIISTVYLRYHYVVDVVGGMFFLWLTLATAPRLFEWWEGRTRSSEAEKLRSSEAKEMRD